MKKYVALSSWARRDHYLFFKEYELPRFNMTFPLDITKFYQQVKAANLKFYYALMHVIIEAMNQMENFRYRIEGEAIVDEPIMFVSFTDMIEGTDLFKMVSAKVDPDRLTFQNNALAASQKQGKQFYNPDSEKVLNTMYVTSFPWAQFTHLTHATRVNAKDSVPRVSWSKFVEQSNKKILNLSIEVHHGLVDGFHLGQLILRIQEKLQAI